MADDNNIQQSHPTASTSMTEGPSTITRPNVKGDIVDYAGRTFKVACEPQSFRESLEGSATSDYDQQQVATFRRELKYHFMNPIDKWKSKKKFPWKLLLQAMKLFIVTIQIWSFGLEISRYKSHQANVDITLREILLSDWDPVREVMTYPPAAGPFACYTKDDLDQQIDYFVKNFSNITTSSLKSFAFDSADPKTVSPIHLNIIRFSRGEENAFNFTYNFNNAIEKDFLVIEDYASAGDPRWDSFSIQQFLASRNYTINFDSLIKININTYLRTIYRNALDSYNLPECYTIKISLVFDNSLHAGQIVMSLNTQSEHKKCFGNLEASSVSKRSVTEISTIIVIALTLLSAILCLRSMIKGLYLRRRTIKFFAEHYGLTLNFQDKSDFIDPWIWMIFINDLLLLIGSIIKLFGDPIDHSQSLTSAYSVLFGIGILLTWTGILRYISFFDKFNIVILTVKKAFPDITKFTFCAILLYIGYCLCGWIVLGPHHLKFRSLSSSSECLFSLLNGDDLYATFATLATEDLVIWWFSRLFIYSFISLFTYVVLSLFISIIMDAWDIIKNYNPQIMTDMQSFIEECDEDVFNQIREDEDRTSFIRRVKSFFKFNAQDTNPLLF